MGQDPEFYIPLYTLMQPYIHTYIYVYLYVCLYIYIYIHGSQVPEFVNSLPATASDSFDALATPSVPQGMRLATMIMTRIVTIAITE